MNGDFELIERDGLARICRLETGHGKVETPAILPVINPNRKLIAADKLRSLFGTEMVITNSYIIYRNEELKQKALREGVHGLLDFDGSVMTDSGTFQTHVYSDVAIDPGEILEFQKRIGSDVATVFDVFSEPHFTREQAESAAGTTAVRVREALSAKRGRSLIAATVQGSLYGDVREKAAVELGGTGADYFSIGGVVPLMENYRFEDLVNVIIASKKGLPPGRPVHLFGAGHPLMLPMATLLGCDVFDSASYVKYAYDGRMMFPEGSYSLTDIRYGWCDCPVCTANTPAELREMEDDERVLKISMHNMHVLTSEIGRIKQAIHEGSLWNLVEARARSSPQLFDAYSAILSGAGYLGRFEPRSRKTGVSFIDGLSFRRPDVDSFIRAASAVRPGASDRLLFVDGERQYFTHFNLGSYSEMEDVASVTRAGIYPLQLTETYPLSQSIYSASAGTEADTAEYASRFGYALQRREEGKWKRDGKDCRRPRSESQVRIVCEYQFGKEGADALAGAGIKCTQSRNTGKLRTVARDGRQILFFRTEDGLFSVKYHGGELLLAALKPPALRVVCTDDAVPFVSAGRSLFTKFVKDADLSLKPGDECLVVDGSDRLLAVGRTILNREEMLSFRKGVAVDIREGRSSSSPSQPPEDMK